VTEKTTIAVVGGTGHQGGGLVRAILDDPDGPFVARVLTRDPDSPKARDLAARGVELVRADLDDEASLHAAFDGAYGAFVYTNYYEQRTPELEAGRSRHQIELDQAQNAARAALSARLRHVVWSTLEDTRPHFAHLGSDVPDVGDGYRVPHFDAKGSANAYFTALGVPTTFLETTLFFEAFLGPRKPRRDSDGKLAITLPMGESVVAMVGWEDVGRTAYGIFQAGARYIGQTISIAAVHLSGEQLAEIFTRGLGEEVVFRPVSREETRKVSQETANMYQFYDEAAEMFLAKRDPETTRAINPRLTSFEDWIAAHREQLLAP
jgi:uncharacterized protein YbjT (DUF2867 family)